MEPTWLHITEGGTSMNRLFHAVVAATMFSLALAALPVIAQSVTYQPGKSGAKASGFALPDSMRMPGPDEGGGDGVLAGALRTAKITPEQIAKIQPLLTEMAGANKSAGEASSQNIDALNKATQAATAAGVANPMDAPEVKAINEAMMKANQEAAAAREKLRDKIVVALQDVASPEQMATIKEHCDMSSLDPMKRNRVMARQWAQKSLPGVTLTADQLDQIATKAAPIQAVFGPKVTDLRKQLAELRQHMAKDDPKDGYAKANKIFAPKMREANGALAKVLNEAIDSVLTDDQKKQAADERNKAFEKSVLTWADKMLNTLGLGKLTDDQSNKAMEIAAAAGEAMLKADRYDSAARQTLADKARADIEQLLTADQKTALAKAMETGRTATLTADSKMTDEEKQAAMEKAMAAGQVSIVSTMGNTTTLTYAPPTYPQAPVPPGMLRDFDKPPCTYR
jgi:hypothetical protein